MSRAPSFKRIAKRIATLTEAGIPVRGFAVKPDGTVEYLTGADADGATLDALDERMRGASGWAK